MAWGNTDGPEMGPEFHGPDRGTNSRWGCAAVSVSSLLVVVVIFYMVIG
jgi:hypothetical protein